MVFYHKGMHRSCLTNSRNYAKINKIDESINSLIECINHAIKFEASTITKYDQLLLNGFINDISSSQTNSVATNKERINKEIHSDRMNKVRENDRFKEVEDLLNKLK